MFKNNKNTFFNKSINKIDLDDIILDSESKIEQLRDLSSSVYSKSNNEAIKKCEIILSNLLNQFETYKKDIYANTKQIQRTINSSL